MVIFYNDKNVKKKLSKKYFIKKKNSVDKMLHIKLHFIFLL